MIPDNAGYYYAAYIATAVIYGGYALSLIVRSRRARARAAPGCARGGARVTALIAQTCGGVATTVGWLGAGLRVKDRASSRARSLPQGEAWSGAPPDQTTHRHDPIAMDASLYFRLTDRIDGAASLDELAAIESEIERTQPHMIERRALERRMKGRERALNGISV